MDFELFYYCQGRGVPHDQAYAEMLDQIVLAERLGFGECWFAEHHFTDYAILPSPNLMIASALQRTRRMRFGNYVNALPFHHPLRLAAEAARSKSPTWKPSVSIRCCWCVASGTSPMSKCAAR